MKLKKNHFFLYFTLAWGFWLSFQAKRFLFFPLNLFEWWDEEVVRDLRIHVTDRFVEDPVLKTSKMSVQIQNRFLQVRERPFCNLANSPVVFIYFIILLQCELDGRIIYYFQLKYIFLFIKFFTL